MPFIPIVQNNQLFMKKICEFSRLVSWGRKVIETKQINKKQLKRPNFLFEGEQSVSGFSVSCLQVCVKRRSWCSAVWMAVICIYFLAQYVQLFSPLLQLGSHHRARTSRPQQVLKWVWLAWQVSAVPASLPRHCPLILILQMSHKPHPKCNTDMVFKTIKQTILWIHGLHTSRKHNKNIVSGAITWFWLSQWYIITLCSCYNAGTWPPSSFCWGERMVVNEMCGLGSSALLLPMAAVS